MNWDGEYQYLDALRLLVKKHENDPTPREDRTGTGTFSTFGAQWGFNLEDGFPLLTTKKLFTKGIIHELLWMLRGETNIDRLVRNNVHIWDQWADADGELGPVYGKQWRAWRGIRRENTNGFEAVEVDQIKQLIHNLKVKPNDRGHVVSAWNPAQLDLMKLRPCHCLFQFYVENGKLSCQLYQRSADIFLGVPFNIASYALLTHLVAREVGLGVGEFIHTFGDLHLYANHVEQAKEQLTRAPLSLPILRIADLDDRAAVPSMFDIQPGDIEIIGYRSHPPIKGDVSI